MYRKPQMKDDIWKFISELSSQRKSTSRTYQIESLAVLEKYGAVASQTTIMDADNLLLVNKVSHSRKDTDNVLPQHETRLNTSDDRDTDIFAVNETPHSTNDDTSIFTANETYVGTSNDSGTIPDVCVGTEPQDSSHDFAGNTCISNLYYLSFKKFKGMEFNKYDRLYLTHASTLPVDSDLHISLRNIALDFLQKAHLVNEEISVLKLALSNAMNLLNPAAIRLVKPFMDDSTKTSLEQKTNEAITQFGNGLSEASSLLYEQLMQETLNSPDDDDLLQLIYHKKSELVASKNRSDERFYVLCILEHVVEGIDDWQTTQEESELTIYRRFGGILDILFRNTKICLADGETISEASSRTMRYNECVYGDSNTTTNNSFGRRIDLIMKSSKEKAIELCTNEWKRQQAGTTVSVNQQNKNIRLNCAVLSHLQSLKHPSKVPFTVAMDWLGTAGYMYILVDVEGIYVARKIGQLIMPRTLLDLEEFKRTLDLLFAFKRFLVNLGYQMDCALQRRETADQLREVIFLDDDDDNPETNPKQRMVFFTPRNSRIKKTKIDLE
ncbi:hypothetical protein BC941DRAFT_443008 [Chlamydoabsidia padenii]|nr:hypothetical protein BC941DRAFT_443008 [Chlamydoabsidia padenii]